MYHMLIKILQIFSSVFKQYSINISLRDVISSRASKVFLSSDFVGQNYLCYLVPHRSQLSLVRLEKTNKQQQIIFGMVTSIVAKGVVNIPVSIY